MKWVSRLTMSGYVAWMSLMFFSCKHDPQLTNNNAVNTAPVFGGEIAVTINGYSSDEMEPFITKDGKYLFFNSLNDAVNTSLFVAERISDTTFNFMGEVGGVNGLPPHLDAVASMDEQNNFFFVSNRNYPTVIQNLQHGLFDSLGVTNVRPVYGNFYLAFPGWIIMDAEISKNGNLLYYVNAHFSGGRLPDQSVIGIAAKSDTLFNKLTNSDSILKNVNNPSFLIYAPCISVDGLELYFTRFNNATSQTEICVAVRSDSALAFGNPSFIYTDASVPEAPTLTADKKLLYYHRKQSGIFHIFLRRRIS